MGEEPRFGSLPFLFGGCMEKLKVSVRKIRKAVAASLAVVLVGWLQRAGVQVENDVVQTVVEAAIVSVVVFLAPANVKSQVKEVVEGE